MPVAEVSHPPQTPKPVVVTPAPLPAVTTKRSHPPHHPTAAPVHVAHHGHHGILDGPVPLGGPVPVVTPAPVAVTTPLPPALASLPGLRPELLTEADLLLADPATHTHPYGSHPLLPIHPGHDQPHSHPPFSDHPVIDLHDPHYLPPVEHHPPPHVLCWS